MPIVNLAVLMPGDVILERGLDAVAEYVGTEVRKYGHASVTINRLLRLEAQGPTKPARVAAFKLTQWHHRTTNEVAVGFFIPGEVLVRRAVSPPDEPSMLSEVNAEIGAEYASADKLAALPDLSLEGATLLKRLYTNLSRKAGKSVGSPHGISCGELVARTLHLGDPEQYSPNSFALNERFETIEEALLDEKAWKKGKLSPNSNELRKLVSNLYPSTINKAVMELIRGRKTLAEIEETVNRQMLINNATLMKIKVMQQEVFGF